MLRQWGRFYLTVVDFGVWWPFDMEDVQQSPFGARQPMIDQHVVAGNVELEIDDHSATGWNGPRLHTLERFVHDAREIIDAIENLADHMK